MIDPKESPKRLPACFPVDGDQDSPMTRVLNGFFSCRRRQRFPTNTCPKWRFLPHMWVGTKVVSFSPTSTSRQKKISNLWLRDKLQVEDTCPTTPQKEKSTESHGSCSSTLFLCLRVDHRVGKATGLRIFKILS